MPAWVWPVEPVAEIRDFEQRHVVPEAGALLHWATLAVESLHYLQDVDDVLERDRLPISGHNPDMVDVAHVRWATSTAMTTLDLCAAAFGRVYCGNHGPNEAKMPNFDPAHARNRGRRSQLPPPALAWVDAIHADARYTEIKSARNSLIHARVPRHFAVGPGPRQRLKLSVDGNRIGVRRLIEDSTSLATEKLVELVRLLPSI